MTIAERPANSKPQSDTVEWARRTAPGMKRGSAAKSSLARTSIRAGPRGTPMRRQSFSEEMLFNDDMMRPRIKTGAILQLSPHGEIASPSVNHNPASPPQSTAAEHSDGRKRPLHAGEMADSP